jgi:S-adenosyl methyltransferase
VGEQGSETSSADPQRSWSRIDTSVAHPARRYNYWLGGKDNFAVDRESGDAVAAVFPTIRTAAVENRGFLRRAVTFLVEEAGIRQFVDIGTGLPSADNTHEVAQRLAPQSRVVYADNDPLVMVHARALLTNASDAGVTDYIEADVRDPDKIVREAARTLDFGRPVALMLVAVLHFIGDDDDPYDVVARLVDALPSGSYLVMSHVTGEFFSEKEMADIAAGRYGPFFPRSREQILRFFDGLELLPPGIVSSAHWRAENEPEPRPTVADTATYSAVARVP